MSEPSVFWAPLLLADPSPSLRLLVLRDLLETQSDNPEVLELISLREMDPLVSNLLSTQESDGSWSQIHTSARSGVVLETAQALTRLGFLGFGPDFRPVEKGAEFLFSQQQDDGSWPLVSEMEDSERYQIYDMIPLQTSMPLRGLASCGYAPDPRSERAYEWLLAQRLPDGAWPTGIASGNYGGVAGYRRLAHSRWGCRTNTTEALRCLALHPERRTGSEARQGLDLLLGRETREVDALGIEVARTIGALPARGLFTYHARYDVALTMDLCWRIGASQEDERVADLVSFVREIRGPYGLWECRASPQASRWLTFVLLRSLARLDEASDWISLEPRTPFRAYPKRRKRH
ncbi:MAG: hypothetical protein GTO63_04005 [Anaerolineae bacterium]|nr:hypothetical protein [Anaerolineae bacterium]NIN94181.1 hypothetical protein [Anaerolineae bacterium]NIQ77224.1 hypothetical protein [Anaerolineae bacterium]